MHSLTFELIWRSVVLPAGHGCTCVLLLPMGPPGALQRAPQQHRSQLLSQH
jgi:hypothetical protein